MILGGWRSVAKLPLIVAMAWTNAARGAENPALYDRGYSVLPEPQVVVLTKRDVSFGSGWRLELAGVPPRDVALATFQEDLKTRFGITLSRGKWGRGVIRLKVAPHGVAISNAVDSNRAALAQQAYWMLIQPESVEIRANSTQGLFYGLGTLVQLVRQEGAKFFLPAGEIIDWPDLELRAIFWDDAHHLERLSELKRAIRQASFFKINGFAIRLEGHFQYRRAAALVEPYALSPAELQELTNYGLHYFVQVIPYLDAPAHDAFILKHLEYARLREYPQSDYEMCVTNPDTYKLLFGMVQDLLAANMGGKYFLLSTDEPYYVGLASNQQCDEATQAKADGSVGRLLAEFITKAAGYLHERGRAVIFWGEYPLKPADIEHLPPYLVNGEVYGPEFDPVFKAHGIRQMVYTSTEGEEPLFPEYFTAVAWEKVHATKLPTMRVNGMVSEITSAVERRQADLMGAVIAGWADEGLHPETFWAGYATGTAVAWHVENLDPRILLDSFFNLFYGSRTVLMARVYQLMSEEAQFWADSWEWAPSSARKPIFGNSDGVFNPPKSARDQTIALPPVPAPSDLSVNLEWKKDNDRRLQLVFKYMLDNGELINLLKNNLGRVNINRYNLEVFASVAEIYEQNLWMILDLGRIDTLLNSAEDAVKKKRPEDAVAALDHALALAENIRQRRNLALRQVTVTWYKSWYPRVEAANGRRFVHVLDDVQDHPPDRTVDLSYLFYRELLLPLGDWVRKVDSVRNVFALENGLPARNDHFDWLDTKILLPAKAGAGLD